MAKEITYCPVVDIRRKRKDGTFNVKIRVTYKRKSRYISTNITAGPREVSAKGDLKGSALIEANALIRRFHQYASELNYFAMRDMDVDGVVRFIHRKGATPAGFRLDFFAWGAKFASTKSPGNAANYLTALRSFRRFVGVDEFDVNEITKQLLLDYAEHLDREPKQVRAAKGRKKPAIAKKQGAAAYGYISRLNAIYQAARERYNDEDAGIVRIPRNPFASVHVKHAPCIARIAKPVDFIQKLIDFDGPCSKAQRLAIDCYLLSFALMGMNPVDMLTAAPVGEDGVLIYNRTKTRKRRPDQAEHRILVDPRIRKILDRYRDPENTHLLNLYRYYRDNRALDGALRASLHSWAKRNGEEPFTMNSARHSFATIARSELVGEDKAVVNECLVHLDPDMKIADVYIEKDWRRLWSANRKVLDLFDWSKVS